MGVHHPPRSRRSSLHFDQVLRRASRRSSLSLTSSLPTNSSFFFFLKSFFGHQGLPMVVLPLFTCMSMPSATSSSIVVPWLRMACGRSNSPRSPALPSTVSRPPLFLLASPRLCVMTMLIRVDRGGAQALEIGSEFCGAGGDVAAGGRPRAVVQTCIIILITFTECCRTHRVALVRPENLRKVALCR